MKELTLTMNAEITAIVKDIPKEMDVCKNPEDAVPKIEAMIKESLGVDDVHVRDFKVFVSKED